jgi:hypothetical protein
MDKIFSTGDIVKIDSQSALGDGKTCYKFLSMDSDGFCELKHTIYVREHIDNLMPVDEEIPPSNIVWMSKEELEKKIYPPNPGKEVS